MTSENELKDAAYRVKRCEAGETLLVVYGTESWPLAKVAYRDDCERLAIAYLARLAADEQHAERIATLERERDEARDLYQRMRQAVAGDGTYGDASQLLAKWGFVNHPESRKDGA